MNYKYLHKTCICILYEYRLSAEIILYIQTFENSENNIFNNYVKDNYIHRELKTNRNSQNITTY